MKTLVDFDSPIYAMASACDGSKWNYKNRQWDLKSIAIRSLEAEGKDPTELFQTKEPEPWDKVERTIVKFCDEFINSLPDPFNVMLLVGGGGNFRYDIATIQPYKGNRVQDKPHHLDAIRDYIVSNYDAKKVYGVEVDDAVGILYEEGDIIVSQDKDLRQLPGRHFHPISKVEDTVTEVEGLRNFYSQVIVGDTSDNILGLFGIGKTSSYVKSIQTMETEEEMSSLVSKLYKQRFGSYYKKFLKENMMLLWMLRSIGSKVPLWQEELMNGDNFYQKDWKEIIFND